MVLNNCVKWNMGASDQQIGFSGRESYTLFSVVVFSLLSGMYIVNSFYERF